MDLLAYLKNAVGDTMGLPELVDAFEKMCQIPLEDIPEEDDMLLFETGTYNFFGKEEFEFSLTRQYPNQIDDEYFQLRLTAFYEPNEKNHPFSDCAWDEDEEVEGDFFGFVRSSEAYQAMQNDKIMRIDVSLEET